VKKVITVSDHESGLERPRNHHIITLLLPMFASHRDSDDAKDLSLDVGVMLRECRIVRQRGERSEKVGEICLHHEHTQTRVSE